MMQALSVPHHLAESGGNVWLELFAVVALGPFVLGALPSLALFPPVFLSPRPAHQRY